MEKKLLFWIYFLLFMLSGKTQTVENSSSSNTYRKLPAQSTWELLTKEKIMEKNLPYKLPDLTKKSYQLPIKIPQNVGDDNSIAYGFLAFDNKFQTRGVAALSTGNPNGVEMINRYGGQAEDPAICAGTMVGDDYWGYLYKFNDDLETDVEVYVKNITEDELDGFIGKPEDFEKVYEGILTIPSGQNWSTLMFDKDFEYIGDNICVMTIRPTDIEYNRGVFNIFKDPSRPNRCWTYFNDHIEYDFADPDAINPRYYHSSEYIPVTKIGFRFKSVGITDNVVSNCELTQHNDRIQFNKVCSTVRIVDVTGKTIGSYRNTDQITIQSLPKGIYIIEFICNDQSNVEKILLY